MRAKTLVPDDSCVREPCTPTTETVSLEEDNATNLAALKTGNTNKVTSETVKLVLEEFPELTKPMSYDRPVKHDVTHTIETSGLPVSCRPRQLSPEMMKIANEQFDDMLEKGIIEPSSGPWSSSLHLDKKKDGSYRCVGDYSRLNNVTTKDSYPLPYLRDFANNLYGMTIFSAIALQSAYHQVLMDPESMEKTTVTPFGAFKYRRMNFGLCNAMRSFQRFITKVISGMENFCFAYVDDQLVASTDAEEHKSHLQMLFQRLADYGLTHFRFLCYLTKRRVLVRNWIGSQKRFRHLNTELL